MEPRKEAIIDALSKFMSQRSGIEFGNYGDVKAFRAEQRSITKDLRQARTLLAAVQWRHGITADDLIKAAQGAYSGRLTIYIHDAFKDSTKPIVTVDYVTGQYFPTEYRRAVCAVLASALWDYTREKAMPKATHFAVREWGNREAHYGTFMYRADAEAELAKLTRERIHDGTSWGTVDDLYDGNSAGDWLRAYFRKEFGRGIASRWFS